MSNFEEKQKAIDEMQKKCDEHLQKTMEVIKKNKSSSQKIDHLMIEMAAQQKCKNDAINAMQHLITLERNQRMAVDLVGKRLDQCQSVAALILAAVMSASEQYDQVLQTKAAKPLFEAIMTDIVISFLPELKILEKAFTRVVRKKDYYSPALIKSYADQGKQGHADFMTKFNKFANRRKDWVIDAGKLLDKEALKDGVNAAKNTVSSNKDADDASRLRDLAFQAKNQIFQQAISSVMSRVVHYTFVASFMYDQINNFTDPNLVLYYTNSVLDSYEMYEENIPSDPNLYNKLTAQILYSMLRKYVSRYCSITITSYGALPHAGSVGADTNIEGLDKSQRRMIYDKFGSKVWQSTPDYPSVNNSTDLVRYWGVTVNRESYDPLMGRRKIKSELA